jgi:ATP-dependent DNA ligase
MIVSKSTARFIEPMECLPVVKSAGKVTLYSRRAKVINVQFGSIVRALEYLPDETVIDGEIIAIDDEGRPNFNLLQNYRSAHTNVIYYTFDIMVYGGADLMQHPLSERPRILRSAIRPEGPIGISEASDRPLADMVNSIEAHGLEGLSGSGWTVRTSLA